MKVKTMLGESDYKKLKTGTMPRYDFEVLFFGDIINEVATNINEQDEFVTLLSELEDNIQDASDWEEAQKIWDAAKKSSGID